MRSSDLYFATGMQDTVLYNISTLSEMLVLMDGGWPYFIENMNAYT